MRSSLLFNATALLLLLLMGGCTASIQDQVATFIPDLLRQTLAAYLF